MGSDVLCILRTSQCSHTVIVTVLFASMVLSSPEITVARVDFPGRGVAGGTESCAAVDRSTRDKGSGRGLE